MLNNILWVFIQLFLCIFIFMAIRLIFENVTLKKKMDLVINKLNKRISQLKRRRPIVSKYKFINTFSLLIISFIFFLVFYIIIHSSFKLKIASFILALPFAFIPYCVLRYNIQQEKERIKRLLPTYAINLKSHITNENNIILAIRRTKVEEPLYKYIAKFISNIDRGMNVHDAFNVLKDAVDIPEFTELILAFQVCYSNGGKFSKILELYSTNVSETIIMREKEKEKTMSSIITLIIMIALNLFLVFSYIFQNQEFAELMRKGLIGRLLVDLNAISCVVCVGFLIKMYRMEE